MCDYKQTSSRCKFGPSTPLAAGAPAWSPPWFVRGKTTPFLVCLVMIAEDSKMGYTGCGDFLKIDVRIMRIGVNVSVGQESAL